LMALGPKRDDMVKRAAVLVDKILKGAKPADLPVQQPTTFDWSSISTSPKTLPKARRTTSM